jgi:hypothetical protein
MEGTEVRPPTEQRVDNSNLPEKPRAECLPGFPMRDLTVPQPPIAPEKAIPVMPPIALPSASTFAGPAPAALPSTSAIPRTDSGLAQTIEVLRLADERFRAVHVDVRGDTVYLGGTVYRWEHLFELARSVSRLPGVRGVRFGEVRAESALSDR